MKYLIVLALFALVAGYVYWRLRPYIRGARRVFATCRRLGIETVAVHSDADAGLPFVAEADHAVRLPGNAPADTYLRIDLLVAAAGQAGADAVHPGYGFLAESAAFAQAVMDAGLVWVGPPPAAIAAMGSKIEAKALMRAAGVPVLPDSSVEGAEDPTAVGFPQLVKASAGGGGRGLRLVRTPAELVEAVRAASGRRPRRSATVRSSSSRPSSGPGTSRCRVWATPPGVSSTCSSATAPCSGATRRSSSWHRLRGWTSRWGCT